MLVEKELPHNVSTDAQRVKRLSSIGVAELEEIEEEAEDGPRRPAKAKSAKGRKVSLLERRIRRKPERPLREPPAGSDYVTLLTRADDGHLTKQILVKRGLDGEPDRLDKADCWMATWYEEPEYVPVRDVYEFHAALVAVRRRQKTSMIIGRFEGYAPDGFVRKVKSSEENHRVRDRETALYVKDVDAAICDHEEYMRDPGAVVAKIRARLGWPWSACTVGWHLSPSGGVTHGMAKFHLEFFGSRRMNEQERLRLWAAASLAYGEDIPGKDAFDYRACWAHQHLFISDPIVTPEAEAHIAAHPEDRLPDIREGILVGEVDELDVDLILKTAPGFRKAKAKTKAKEADAPVPTDDFGDEIDPVKASAKVKRAVAAGVLRPRRKGEFVRYPDKYLLSAIPEGIKKLMDLRFGVDGPVTEGSNTFALAWGELAAADEVCYCKPGMANDVIDGVRHRFPDKDDAWWIRRLSGVALRLNLHRRDYVSDLGDGVIRTPICTRRKANWIALLNVSDAEQVAIPELRGETVARRLDRREKGLVKSKAERADDIAGRNAMVLRLKAEGKTAREIGEAVGLTPETVANLLSKLRKRSVESHISCQPRTVITLSPSSAPHGGGLRESQGSGLHQDSLESTPNKGESVTYRAGSREALRGGVAASGGEDAPAVAQADGEALEAVQAPVEAMPEDQGAERPCETPTTTAPRSAPVIEPVEDLLAAFDGVAVAPRDAGDDGSVWPDEDAREDFEIDMAALDEAERVRRGEAAVTILVAGGSKGDLLALYPEAPSLSAALRMAALRAREIGWEAMAAAGAQAMGLVPYDLAMESEWNTRAARTAPSRQQVALLDRLAAEADVKVDSLAWADWRRCSKAIDRLQAVLARRRAREERKTAKGRSASVT